MPAEVEQYLSGFHREYMKPRGFRKTRHTFSRERDGYVELFEIQGSAWNDSASPWRFYINVGVDFPDIPPRSRVRIRTVVAAAPDHFDLSLLADDAFTADLVSLIDAASESVSAQLPAIREALAQRRHWVGY